MPLWNVRSLRALHESFIQMLKVAMVRSNYNKSKASARKLNSQFVRDQRSVYRDFQKSHPPQNVPNVSTTEQFWKSLYSESQFDSKCLSLNILREFVLDCDFNYSENWERFTCFEIKNVIKKLPS